MIEFAQANAGLSSAWLAVAVLLAISHIKHMANGPKAVSSQILTNLVNRDNGIVIDIRAASEFNKGHIHGARNIPLSKIKETTKDLEKYKNTPIIMVCQNGISVAAACSILKKAGMEKVYKLSGGMTSWVGDNLPTVKS